MMKGNFKALFMLDCEIWESYAPVYWSWPLGKWLALWVAIKKRSSF
jgi:hypothetical protein